MPLLSSVKPVPNDSARNQAERILALSALIPIVLQPVFADWLGRHSGGVVSNPSKTVLVAWLAGMDPGRANAEYQLILAQIAWLELLSESTQIDALQKETL